MNLEQDIIAEAIGAEVFPSRLQPIADQLEKINPNFNRQKFIDRAEAAWLKAHEDEWKVDDEIPY